MGAEVNCPFCKAQRVNVVESIPVKSFIRVLKEKNIQTLKKTIEGLQEIKYYACDECGLRFFFPLITGDTSYYESVSSDKNYYEWTTARNDFSEAAKYVTEELAILDIGCGQGEFQKLVNSDHYTGLEFNTHAVKLAQEKGYRVFNQNIEEHARDNFEKYDLIVCFQVIEHIADPKSFLSETVKCLKPNGLLIISTPNNDSYLRYLTNASSNLPPHHVLHWNETSLKSIRKYLPLEVLHVHKEILTEDNKNDYTRSVLLAYFLSFFNFKIRLVDFSFHFRLFNKLAKICQPTLNKVIRGSDLLPSGHTLTVIYKKIK